VWYRSCRDYSRSEGMVSEESFGFHLFFLGSGGRAFIQLVVPWVNQRGGSGAISQPEALGTTRKKKKVLLILLDC